MIIMHSIRKYVYLVTLYTINVNVEIILGYFAYAFFIPKTNEIILHICNLLQEHDILVDCVHIIIL